MFTIHSNLQLVLSNSYTDPQNAYKRHPWPVNAEPDPLIRSEPFPAPSVHEPNELPLLPAQ